MIANVLPCAFSRAYNTTGRVSQIGRLCNCETCQTFGTLGAQEPVTRIILLLYFISSPFEIIATINDQPLTRNHTNMYDFRRAAILNG